MVTTPVFLYIFANGAVWSPSTFLYLWSCGGTWGCLFLGCGSIFMGGFEVIAGGIVQSFLNSTQIPDIFPASGHGVPAQVGIFSNGEGLLSEVFSWGGFCFSGFVWALRAVLLVLGMGLGLATTFTLYFFVGMSFLIFSVSFVSFLTWGFVLGWLGLDWLGWHWNFEPNFPSNLR